VSELARAQALRIAAEFRTHATTPEQTLELAKTFEAYIVGDTPSRSARRLPDKGVSSPVARA
jgi:hypothetical protein